LMWRCIPDWHELEWSEVERVRGYYAVRQEECLVLDAIYPLATKDDRALRYVQDA
jgi:hypothetical protein